MYPQWNHETLVCNNATLASVDWSCHKTSPAWIHTEAEGAIPRRCAEFGRTQISAQCHQQMCLVSGQWQSKRLNARGFKQIQFGTSPSMTKGTQMRAQHWNG